MKANADKCHLLVTRDTDVTAKIGEFDVKNNREEKLLGVKTDTKLSFKSYVPSLCKMQAKSYMHSQESSRSIIMDLAKRASLMKAFITPQFHYLPLILKRALRLYHTRKRNLLLMSSWS